MSAAVLKRKKDDDDDFKPENEKRRKSQRLTAKPKFQVAPPNVRDIMTYFGKSSKVKQNEAKALADKTRKAFLQSGVPEAIIKAQKVVEQKREEDDFLDTVQFFPKYSHNISIEPNQHLLTYAPAKWPCALHMEQQKQSNLQSTFQMYNLILKHDIAALEHLCCKKPEPPKKPGRFARKLELDCQNNSGDEGLPLPWVEKYAVKRKKKLVVDKSSSHKFERWLAQWKQDIDDDGGISRKVVQKRRNSDSDSDCFTDEEDGEFKKKSVILCGPTGCGKTSLVYVMSRHLGFKVVEVNFSSRRSGKEVMQKVEEATLSHQLSDSVEVDENHCLVLFKDIDLLHDKEDEGFHAAIAQLINASVRPIVMTTCHPCSLDVKIEKKDPLWIYFSCPLPTVIVQKIILPIFKSEFHEVSFGDEETSYITSVLEATVRHSYCDIRRSINQCQVICWNKMFNMDQVHKDLSPLNDFGHREPDGVIAKPENQTISHTPFLSRAEKLENLEELDRISKNMELLADSDIMLKFQSTDDDQVPDRCQIRADLHSYSQTLLGKGMKGRTNSELSIQDLYQVLMFKSDADIVKDIKTDKLSEELNPYVDFVDDYDSKAYVRTIVKTSLLNSVGQMGKRNGRIKGYFNRISPDFVQRISDTFGFQTLLDIANAAETDIS